MINKNEELYINALHIILEIKQKLNSSIFDEVYYSLITDTDFMKGPSSTSFHHVYKYGNIIHTSEVLELVYNQTEIINRHRRLRNIPELPIDIVCTCALLHDYGKKFTYLYKNGIWDKVPEYTKSLHIEKSIEKAQTIFKDLDPTILNQIIQCIGAHHGRKEWGALWEPKSPIDWILHLSDMASVFGIEDRK